MKNTFTLMRFQIDKETYNFSDTKTINFKTGLSGACWAKKQKTKKNISNIYTHHIIYFILIVNTAFLIFFQFIL